VVPGLSPDREQQFICVTNGGDEKVKIFNRVSVEVLKSFGGP